MEWKGKFFPGIGWVRQKEETRRFNDQFLVLPREIFYRGVDCIRGVARAGRCRGTSARAPELVARCTVPITFLDGWKNMNGIRNYILILLPCLISAVPLYSICKYVYV